MDEQNRKDTPMSKKKTDLDLEWEKRTLCSDGNCIGVIGDDGRCKECGNPHDPDMSTTEEAEHVEEPAPDSDVSMEGISDDEPEISDEDIDLEWEDRRLCSDGNCIGVIGSDGNCKECGKPFEG